MMTFNPFHAAARFGLGGSQTDLEAIGTKPAEWVMAQVNDKAKLLIEGVPGSRAQVAAYLSFVRENRAARSARSTDLEKLKERQKSYRASVREEVISQVTKRFAHAVRTGYPVKERLVEFWANHFTVSRANKPQLASLCCGFENEAIRPALDEHFTDMLLRVASHPTMLMYLDNFQSVGADSIVGRRRNLGINENFARELMELHTLGVDGGYTQADVSSLAEVLTGWTVGNERLARLGATPGEFAFVQAMHEPGAQTVLGKTYKAPGRKQGIDVLVDLSLNPSTARHIATKLVRHFVSDDPRARDVEFVSSVYLKSDGHLPSVHKAVVSLASAWKGADKKLKTPWELLVSTWRGLDLPVDRSRPIIGTLQAMNNLPFSAPSPAGWPDTAEYWGSPAIIKERVQWGIAAGRLLGNRFDAMDAAGYMVDVKQAKVLLSSIQKAESPAQGLALLLSSPDFQWR